MDFYWPPKYLPTPSCPRRYWMTPKLSLGVTFVEFLGGLASDSKQNSMKLIQTTPVKRQALSNEISLWHIHTTVQYYEGIGSNH